MRTQKKKSDWSNEVELTARSTKEVIEDHIQLQIAGQLEEDLHRNYDTDAVLLTEFGHFRGHAAWRTHLDRDSIGRPRGRITRFCRFRRAAITRSWSGKRVRPVT